VLGKKRILVAAASAGVILGLAELLFLDLPVHQGALLFFATLFVPPSFAYAYTDYTDSKRNKEIEAALPEALFQAASFPGESGTEEVLRSIAHSGYGALSVEFAKACKRVRAGTSVPRALERMAKENDSTLLSRVIRLLSNAYERGGNQSLAFKEAAEEALQMQLLEKENAASLATQKYTLLAASAVLVPAILALLLNIVSTLGEGLASGILAYSTASNAEREALLNAVATGNAVYLAAFAAMSSYFVASFEGNAKKAVIYAAFTVPTALLLFETIRNASII